MSELFSFDSSVKTIYSHPILELYRDKIEKKLEEEIDSLDKFQKEVCAVSSEKSMKVIANAGCLTGDSEIKFNRAGEAFKMPLSKAYKHWTGEFQKHLGRKILWDKDIPTKVRSLHDNGEIKLHPIEGIVESGIKAIYELILEDGKRIKGTPCHKIRTNKGWVPLGELIEGDKVLVDSHAKGFSNFKYDIPLEVPVSKVIDLKKKEMTYDIQCHKPNHNFVANNIIVHNSGKTKVLITRALKMIITERIDPSEIVLITFTNKASKEIRSRFMDFFKDIIEDESELELIPIPNISTIHSFGFNSLFRVIGIHKTILNEYSGLKLLRNIMQECTNAEKIPMGDVKRLYEEIDSFYARNEGHLLTYIKFSDRGEFEGSYSIRDASEKFPKEITKLHHLSYSHMVDTFEGADLDIDPDYLVELADDLISESASNCMMGSRMFTLIATRFMEDRCKTGAMTFSDCMYLPQLLCIQHDNIMEKMARTYQYFSMDESQDNDNLNFGLIKTIAGKDPKIMLVGDSKQTLFTWRNANPEILENLEKVLDTEVVETQLLTNYRSPKQHVILSNLFSNSFRDKTIHHSEPFNKPVSGCIHISDYDNSKQEMNFIGSEILSLVDQGYKYSDISVISRTNKSLLNIEAALITYGIPNIPKHDSRSLTRMSTFKFMFSIYSILLNHKDVNSLVEILGSVKGAGVKFTDEIYAKFMQNLNSDPSFTIFKISKENFSGESKKYEVLYDLINYILTPIKNKFQTANMSLPELNSEILRVLRSQALLEGDTYNTSFHIGLQFDLKVLIKVLNTFDNICHIMEEEGTLTEMSETEKFVHIYETLQLSQDPSKDGDDQNKVMISTIHAYKGKEADAVFFCNLNRLQPVLPEEREEERCCFYVGITRAKKKLYLTSSAYMQDYSNSLRRACPSIYLEKYMDCIINMQS